MKKSRNKNKILYPYVLNDSQLSTINCVRDLSVVYDERLSYTKHTININRANKSFGFIFRFCKNFRNAFTLNTLYNSLFIPHLEFAYIIWSLYQFKYIQLIERRKHNFLSFVLRAFSCWIQSRNYDYDSALRILNMLTL